MDKRLQIELIKKSLDVAINLLDALEKEMEE